jgi:hypothetical protein
MPHTHYIAVSNQTNHPALGWVLRLSKPGKVWHVEALDTNGIARGAWDNVSPRLSVAIVMARQNVRKYNLVSLYSAS